MAAGCFVSLLGIDSLFVDEEGFSVQFEGVVVDLSEIVPPAESQCFRGGCLEGIFSAEDQLVVFGCDLQFQVVIVFEET